MPKTHDGNRFEAVMINTAGGMTGGDHIDWHYDLGHNTNTVLTTQACERIYKSAGGSARTDIHLTLADNASLAWLPQETILFDQSRFERTITVEMSPTSRLLFLEPVAFGRTTMGESIDQGWLRDHWKFFCNGDLFHADFFNLSGDISTWLGRSAIANGNLAMATLLLVSQDAEMKLDAARALIGKNGGASWWKTAGIGKLLARIVARDSYELRKTLLPVVDMLNDKAALPKCWSL